MPINTNSSVRRQIPSGYAEKKEAAPKLALLDDFDGDPAGFPHGQAVESILFSHSDLKDPDVQRYQNDAKQADLTRLMREQNLDFLTAYQTMVVRDISHFYLQTAVNLHKILDEQPSVKVISQSQGDTPGRHLEGLFNGIQNNQAFREGAARSLGLGPDASAADVCGGLLRVADKAVAEDDNVKKARGEYEKVTKKLHENGITYLVAAGNHGDIGAVLNSLGVQASPNTFRNILVNDFVTVVGALDPKGDPSQINSPGTAIEVYRRGESLDWEAGEGFNQKGNASGTSFATPIAAGEAVNYLQSHPQAGPFEVEGHLAGLDSYRVGRGQTVDTANGQKLVGDGKLESYIQTQLGEGFITDVASDDAAAFARSAQGNQLFGLPGKNDHEFQLIKWRTDTEGIRKLTVDTYFLEGHHVVEAVAQDGKWAPDSVVEELHLDPGRRKEIENSKQ